MTSPLRVRKAPAEGAGAGSSYGDDPSGKLKATALRSRQSAGAKGAWFLALAGVVCFALAVVYVQTVRLPKPLSAEEAGKLGFSEERALSHLEVLTSFGARPIGSDNLDHALMYVLRSLESMRSKMNPNVFMEVEHFHSKPGTVRLLTGLFKGRTHVYADLSHILVRLSSKFSVDAEDTAILVSSHVDTVYTSPGGGDCGSCISVMLELIRALSHTAQSFKHSVIFLFNTGEEEGLIGAHSFITQHSWNSSIKTVVDLEAMGAGGPAKLFQAGPDKWLLDVFAKVAKYPAANIVAQDVFQAGLIKSATDFQIYKEIAGLSGLDFAYIENGAVYHTRNDKHKLVRPGSLQQLGDNMLPLLVEVAQSPHLANAELIKEDTKLQTVYFDVLGRYMVTFSQDFAKLLYISIFLQSLLLFAGSLVRAEHFALPGLAIAASGVLLSWIFSISLAAIAATLVPRLSVYAVPYIAHPLLAVGLFGAPALFGAAFGHSLGQKMLHRYLLRSMSDASAVASETEKLMFKAVFLQWLLFLLLGAWRGVGSTYIALSWLVSPAVAYGMKESRLSKHRPSRKLSFWTLVLGLPLPIVLTADVFLSLPSTLVGNLVRFDRNPGAVDPWIANLVIACMIAGIICCSISYLLPYIYREGIVWILLTTIFVFILSLAMISCELLPAFTKDVGKGTHVVHVIDANMENKPSQSYISVSFTTPGGPEKEVQSLVQNGFRCGPTQGPDFVNFEVKKGCEKPAILDAKLWEDRPTFAVASDDVVEDRRVTYISLKTKQSHRWALSIDTNKIQAVQMHTKQSGSKETLASIDNIVGMNGRHVVQFASGKSGPRDFGIQLVWRKDHATNGSDDALLKLRTDVNTWTADAARTLKMLPDSCVLFGKSTSPYPLAYLTSLNLA